MIKFILRKVQLTLLLLSVIISSAAAQSFSSETFKELKYRFIGPEGNRAIAITRDLDLWQGQLGPWVAPGQYYIKVKIGDVETIKPVEVLKDSQYGRNGGEHPGASCLLFAIKGHHEYGGGND